MYYKSQKPRDFRGIPLKRKMSILNIFKAKVAIGHIQLTILHFSLLIKVKLLFKMFILLKFLKHTENTSLSLLLKNVCNLKSKFLIENNYS